MQVVRQPLQASRLPTVQRLIALRVVAHQHLAEGWVEGLDVCGEALAVLEVELLLSTLLRGARRHVALRCRIAKDCGTELLVHQDTGFLLGHPSRNSSLEAVVDHLLGGSDLRRLLRIERTLPAEHSRLERTAMVEGQDI